MALALRLPQLFSSFFTKLNNLFNKAIFWSKTSIKVYFGVLFLCLISFSCMATTQLLKATYIPSEKQNISSNNLEVNFSAPFLTSWFCMAWTTLFFPLYLTTTTIFYWWRKTNISSPSLFSGVLEKFHLEGISVGNKISYLLTTFKNYKIPGVLFLRSFLFSLLSVFTNYLYILSLRYWNNNNKHFQLGKTLNKQNPT